METNKYQIPDGYPKIAVPDKAAKILTEMGYPVSAPFIRRLIKQKKIAAVFTGARYLVNISSCVRYFEEGDQEPRDLDMDDYMAGIRKIDEGVGV